MLSISGGEESIRQLGGSAYRASDRVKARRAQAVVAAEPARLGTCALLRGQAHRNSARPFKRLYPRAEEAGDMGLVVAESEFRRRQAPHRLTESQKQGAGLGLCDDAEQLLRAQLEAEGP